MAPSLASLGEMSPCSHIFFHLVFMGSRRVEENDGDLSQHRQTHKPTDKDLNTGFTARVWSEADAQTENKVSLVLLDKR